MVCLSEENFCIWHQFGCSDPESKMRLVTLPRDIKHGFELGVISRHFEVDIFLWTMLNFIFKKAFPDFILSSFRTYLNRFVQKFNDIFSHCTSFHCHVDSAVEFRCHGNGPLIKPGGSSQCCMFRIIVDWCCGCRSRHL